MQKTFRGIQLFKVQTRDFMFCDVQKRFTDVNYPSDAHMNQIASHIHSVDANGVFKALQTGLLQGSAFG